MQPLNPFLAAFSKSPLANQCQPTRLHILLVPCTDVILDSRDTETGAPLVDSIASDEFLGSHVIRLNAPKPGPAGAKEPPQNLREVRGKTKVYNTVNGRSLVIKDNLVYSNKGFKALAHATLLNDAVWYADTLDPKPFLIYYISRPLVGNWDEVRITPALVPAERTPGASAQQQNGTSRTGATESAAHPRKKDIKSFHDLLNNFPVIARQMQNGFEKLFHEFTIAFNRPLPPPPSAVDIPDPEPDGPIVAAMKKARSSSFGNGSAPNLQENGLDRPTENFFAEDDEDVMRVSLETAVTTAIDLFQSVDKQQLSLLGATTDLTGPLVERLIERYVSENIHHLLFQRLTALKRPEDLELEAKIRQMEFIDISQLGIAIDGGSRGKHDLVTRLESAVAEFKKMTSAMSPQEMMDILLSTTKLVTHVTDSPGDAGGKPKESEKPITTVNADTLVSLLLYVVIRSQIKHLGARLIYIRHFIFIDDVDSGEIGYALSTFEAVLSYLDRDSSGLRRASRRNKALWDAVRQGDLPGLKKMMEETPEDVDECAVESYPSSRRASAASWTFTNGSSRRSSSAFTVSERFSLGSSLSHVFPFQNGGSSPEDPLQPAFKRIKKVAMDTRSMSSSSEISFRSRATSFGTLASGIEGDTSIERLSQTQDSNGESVLMMAIQSERPGVLKYLLSLKQYFPPSTVLEDRNNQGTTLLSAAVQIGHTELINHILDFLFESHVSDDKIRDYLAIQDTWGRSAAHYLFHAPFLINHIGRMLPWRQRDNNGRTPLFALCRSYDHSSYAEMVEQGLDMATRTQGDGEHLHLDYHIDNKGNTLLHIVNDAALAFRILQQCDVDVNAINDKRFTPLMLASKYGRFDLVRVLFNDDRVDRGAKETRGLTAVELAKDDDVRNRIDDLTLFSLSPCPDKRTTGVVRSYFVEDSSIRFVLKSGAPVDNYSYAVTTCRRSLTDFEHLFRLLELENPASWIPSLDNLRSPTQVPSRPSRAVLKELQVRMDWFLRVLLTHPTFATHEMLWEFFLVPDLQLDTMEERSRLKAETRAEKVRDELEPVEDVREVEQFVDHAREMVRSVHFSTRSVARRSNVVGSVALDLYDAAQLLDKALSTVLFLPEAHRAAFTVYMRALMPTTNAPPTIFFNTFLALYANVEAILRALSRPPELISQISTLRREIERNHSNMHRSSRWPLGLLDDTRHRVNEEREDKIRRSREDVANLGKELRYTQQTVANELAGWREMHEKMGRKAIRDLARGMVTTEKTRLAGMERALRKLRESMRDASSETRFAEAGSMTQGIVERPNPPLFGNDDEAGEASGGPA
ncbi:hypothetical protein GQ53DRAFT_793278 [Thozetella sp. PMI_491]|nr:hypothetical protein GQ53DRAFT_793278 [Thozetella sp. PMI_491]